MKIDTAIHHVTRPGDNLFQQLGFAPAEAQRLLHASQRQINDTRALKEQLMSAISQWIARHRLKQAQAAEVLMISRPRVSDVVNHKSAKFSIDMLVELLGRTGQPVRLVIGEA